MYGLPQVIRDRDRDIWVLVRSEGRYVLVTNYGGEERSPSSITCSLETLESMYGPIEVPTWNTVTR